MKIRQILAAALLLCAVSASAQTYDVLEKVAADGRKMAAMEGVHRFDAAPLTPSPEGYEPFYIGHYGRHGSRYAWNSKTYSYIRDVFRNAYKKRALTAVGEDFYNKYEQFWEIPLLNAGDLAPLGFEQHQRIARFTYESFPEVFEGSRKVSARSSTSQRCIVSMSAFLSGLAACAPELQFSAISNHTGMADIVPPSAPKELRKKFKGQGDTPKIMKPEEFSRRTLDYDSILSRLFTDPSAVVEDKGKFVSEMFSLLGGYHNYCDEPLFDDAVTPENMLKMWEASNYSSFYGDITTRYAMIPLLEDIIAKAEAAFGDPSVAADLRFGHDYIVEAFSCLLDLNGCGTVPNDPSEAKYWFQSYNVPMASTLHFVFYRAAEGSDILFKILWNEQEAVLPQLTPVTGPYYRWSDFRAWSDKLLEEHPQE